jgi:hypothetical protein
MRSCLPRSMHDVPRSTLAVASWSLSFVVCSGIAMVFFVQRSLPSPPGGSSEDEVKTVGGQASSQVHQQPSVKRSRQGPVPSDATLGALAVDIMYRGKPVDITCPGVQYLRTAIADRGARIARDSFWLTVSRRPPPFPVVCRLSVKLECPLPPRQFGYSCTQELVEQLQSFVDWYQLPRGRESDADELSFVMAVGDGSRGGSAGLNLDSGGGVCDTVQVQEALRTCVEADVVLQGLLDNQSVPSGHPKGTYPEVATFPACRCSPYVLLPAMFARTTPVC